MFHRYGKKKEPLNAKSFKDLIPMASVDQLLADEKRKTLLLQIQEACKLEPARFNGLCFSIVTNLINHCQSLPDSSNSYYAQQGGYLDYALNRTDIALNLFKQYVVQDENTEFSEEQKLWQYALLSAALLQGIGKLQIDYQVLLYDNNGQFLKQWNPVLENLPLGGSHFTYQFTKESNDEFRKRLNILLARLLMPVSGFTWIASNPEVLAVWLALLNEDAHSARTLGALLIQADSLAVWRYLNEIGIKNPSSKAGRYGRAGTFAGGVPESLSEKELLIGAEFIRWLNQSLSSGALVINKAPLLMVPGGMLLTEEIFKLFIEQHPQFKPWQAVKNGFLSLGLHKVGPDGDVMSRFEQVNNQQMHTGIVFSGYAVALSNQVKVQQINSGKISTQSALELIHSAQTNHHFASKQMNAKAQQLQVLNATGQWIAKTAVVSAEASIKPGANKGG